MKSLRSPVQWKFRDYVDIGVQHFLVVNEGEKRS